VNPAYITATTEEGYSSLFGLVDNNPVTGVQYDLPEAGEGSVVITLRASQPVLSSGLVFDFERNVALPTSIEVRASTMEAGMNERIVLARSRMTSEYVQFIPTTATSWTIRLTYAQPLKINELTLKQDSPESSVSRSLRFLAQPRASYTIFQNPEAQVVLPYFQNSGNLTDNEGVLQVSAGPVVLNERFVPSDIDGDGIRDTMDNCVSVSNFAQLDVDGNGRGDACEDFDRDGIINSLDNCPNLPNGDQRDEDTDGIGDVCDTEESRITERHTWVPWAGMGIAAVVLVGLFAFVAMRPMRSETEAGDNGTPPAPTV
jgi:hypothetical protein